MRERWLNVRMLSRPNQRWLLRSSGFFIAPCYPKRSFRERRRSGKVAAMSAQLRHRAAAKAPARPTEPSSGDRIESVRLSLAYLPLAAPISDAKVLTGLQKPLTEIAFTFAEIRTRDGLEGLGFGYSKRAAGPGMYAHAKEIAPNLLREDPSAISRIFSKLLWAGASVGRSGLTVQAIAPFDIALWDIKATRATLPLPTHRRPHRESGECYSNAAGFV